MGDPGNCDAAVPVKVKKAAFSTVETRTAAFAFGCRARASFLEKLRQLVGK
jgi:hypothetical protein